MFQKLFQFFDVDEDHHSSYGVILVLALVLHVVVLVVVPFLITLFWKAETFERPETMQLVTIEQVQKPQPAPPVETVKTPPKPEVAPEPVPKKVEPKKVTPPKPTPKKKPKKSVDPAPTPEVIPEPVAEPEPIEDLSDLEALFGAPPVQTSAVTASHAIPNRYLMAIKGKVEPNWKPTLRDSTLRVVLSFTISLNGTLDGVVSISKGSGNSIIDRQAKRAIELAAPFPTLPNNFRGDKLKLTYTLIPYKG